MIYYSVVTELPDSEPVTLAEAKDHLHVDGDSENTYITTLIKVARRMCEAYAGLSFVTQQREIKMDYFPACGKEIILPYGPVQTVESFEYVDSDGDDQTLTEDTDFMVDYNSKPARVFAIDDDGAVTTWPTAQSRPNAVTVGYTAGYDDVSGGATPDQVKQAILMQVGAMYENRQDEVTGSGGVQTTILHFGSQAMLDSVKVYWNANY